MPISVGLYFFLDFRMAMLKYLLWIFSLASPANTNHIKQPKIGLSRNNAACGIFDKQNALQLLGYEQQYRRAPHINLRLMLMCGQTSLISTGTGIAYSIIEQQNYCVSSFLLTFAY
jgi:hypothetical protein